jgi:Family of unknown function (DUF5941)
MSEPLVLYRDDGPLARALGRLGAPLPPLAVIAAGAAPLVVALAADLGRPLRAAIVAWLVVIAGLSGGRVGGGRLRWAVPPALRAAEYGAVLWLAQSAAADAAFVLLFAVALRHYDLVYRRSAPPAWLAAIGWEVRLLGAAALLLAGALRPGLFVAGALLGIATAAVSAASWRQAV